ncbi:hypothetical protein IWX78_001526 [Mycetocola sp. CAN_C7]|uniref:hypothetical protein n=1 Tax=Mycetocola sp. CAN_C7 TaxID=2787724 RepID=UPI0018C9F795
MVSGSSGALDTDDGTPQSHASTPPGGVERLDYDEFDLGYDGSTGSSGSSFSHDDFDD